MKKLAAILSIMLTASTVFAANTAPRKETATKAALAMAKVNWAYMGKKLDLQVFQTTEKGRDVKVELGIGTDTHPARMNACVTVSFDDGGNIKNIANEIASVSCE